MILEIVSKMIKLDGELAKVILNDKPLHEIDILLQSSKSNSLEENQINLAYWSVDEIFEGKESSCEDYIKFLKKNHFYENDYNHNSKLLKISPAAIMNKTIIQANKDNVFLKNLNQFDSFKNLAKLLSK
jgi:hypothetical protein